MEATLAILLAVAIFIVLPALIGFVILGAIRVAKRSKVNEKQVAGIACGIDADCPEGYICSKGACVPA